MKNFNETRMSKWMYGVAKLDRIRNEGIRGTVKVGEISKKVQESTFKYYGHVMRREKGMWVKSDGYSREDKERKTETEVDGQHQGRDRFASSGRGIRSAGSRIVAHETIDQTETGRRWLTMFTFLRLQLKYKNG